MFDEDDNSDVMIMPPAARAAQLRVTLVVSPGQVITPAGFDEDTVGETDIDETPVPVTPPEVRTLRELLLDAENTATLLGPDIRPSSGVKRLREKRVNRTLAVVSDWLLSQMTAVEHEIDGENIMLLNLAEDTRGLIAWPEQEAFDAQEPSRVAEVRD
jgi:hypothetical protein